MDWKSMVYTPAAPWPDAMAEGGWRRAPAPADPAALQWTKQAPATRDVVAAVMLTAPVPDEHPLPSVDPPHPRLERVLSWVAPWWATRRAAARVARHQRAVWARIAAAYDDRRRGRYPEDLPSRAGPRWRGSRYWQRWMLVVAPAPRLDAQLLDVQQIVPAQLPRRAVGQDTGARALFVRLLQLALWDAGLGATGTGRRGPTRPARPRPAQVVAARRWLVGDLDDQVALPIGFVCDALGLDADVLAAAVRTGTTPWAPTHRPAWHALNDRRQLSTAFVETAPMTRRIGSLSHFGVESTINAWKRR
jgi:hypothetical protein